VRAYVDASVVLRIVLVEPSPLREWRRITQPISSELVRLECLRTIDRARIRFQLPDAEVAEQRAALLEKLDGFELIPMNRAVLARAAEPFPTALGALDAVHLASALLARMLRDDLSLATHDRELAIAARAVGFRVLGTPAAAIRP
jgi:predicted nucleic acid-binding protein